MVSRAVVAVVLRALTAASRFALFLYMGRYLAPEALGAYGMIAATVGLIVQFVGLEFHYFNSREMLAVGETQRAHLIRDQFVLHGLTYALVLPGVLLVFVAGILEWRYAIYVFPLIVAEHLSQELFRVLVTCFRPVLATVVIFIRTALWVYLFIALSRFAGGRGSVEQLLSVWLVFSTGSVTLGGIALYQQFKESPPMRVDWGWLRRGVRRSLPFLVTTVCFTGLQFVDRFVLNRYLGEGEVGVFFFFASLAAFLYLVLTFGIGIFHGPKTIHAYQSADEAAYRRERAMLLRRYAQGMSLLIVPAALAIYAVLWWVDKPIYAQNIGVYWIMLAANVALIVADLVNFDLYVRGRDSAIMWAAVIAILCSVCLQLLLVPLYGMIGAAVATATAYVTLGVVRYAFLRYGTRDGEVKMARALT